MAASRLFGTVEDLYTQSYVLPLLVPMLENAGAYVMIPRERDLSVHELIIDRDGHHAVGHYSEHNGKRHWDDAPAPGFAYRKTILEDGDNPFAMGGARMVKSVTDPTHESIAAWTGRHTRHRPICRLHQLSVTARKLPECTLYRQLDAGRDTFHRRPAQRRRHLDISRHISDGKRTP